MQVKNQIPNTLLAGIGIALFFTFMWSPNFIITIPVLFYIPFIYFLFYKKGNANVLFWGLLYQWITVSIQLLYSNFLGISLEEYFANTVLPAELMNYTVFLSTIGLYVFSFGIHLAIRLVKIQIDESLWIKYNPLKLLQVYVIVSIIIYISQVAIWTFPGLVQYFYFLFYIKWGFFLITFFAVFRFAPKLKIYLFVIIAVEFVLGLSSFFASSFINILIFSVIAYMSVSKKISFQKGLLFILMIFLLFHISVLWTASKGNYRSFLTEGKISQTVTVSDDKARAKLLELVVSIDQKTYRKAIDDVINRIGYIQFFAASIRYVPAKIPHENGRIYWAAISHFLIPRFIDPDKPALDDSKHTNMYTGLNVSGLKSATSFSLGSFADAYIDYGSTLMFIPIFLFGYMIGLFYKYLYKIAYNSFWGIILTGPFFLLVNIYGTDTAKALGFLLIYFITIAILSSFLMQFFNPLMLEKQKEPNQ